MHHRQTPTERRPASLLGACALALALALVACRSEAESAPSSDAMSPASTLAAATLPAVTVPASAVSSTTAPVALPTTTTLAPATSTTVAPESTVASTTVAPASTRPLVAVNDSGDAVLFAADGSLVLLYDGADPDDDVEEGPQVLVDGVAVTDDRSLSIVSLCCEPSPGTMFRTTPPAVPAVDAEAKFGHGPDISPDGTRVATVAVDWVGVSDLAFENETSLEVPNAVDTSPSAVIWATDSRLVVLDESPTGTTLRAADIDAAGVMTWVAESEIATRSADVPSTLRFAGRADGIVYVADLGSNVVRAFDATSLAPVAASDVTLVASPLSVWIEDGETRWIDGGRTLHVGEATVPGSYVWVR